MKINPYEVPECFATGKGEKCDTCFFFKDCAYELEMSEMGKENNENTD